jgi:hypothetical protein
MPRSKAVGITRKEITQKTETNVCQQTTERQVLNYMVSVVSHRGAPTASTADEWAALSIEKLQSVEQLMRIRQRQLAYDQLGYAVECAIKALIMRRKRLNRWPDRDNAPQLYVHGLNALMKQTGIFQIFCQMRRRNERFRHYWLVVKDWVPSRYATQQPSGRVIEDMRRAITDPNDGIIAWLNRQ